VLDELEPLLAAGGAPAAGPATTAGADLAAGGKKHLAAWTPSIKAALAAQGPNAAALAQLLAHALWLSKPRGDMVQALARLAECNALATGGAAAAPGAQTPAALWNAARAAAVACLRDEIKKVLASNHPDAAQAELELKAVLMQLTGKLETQQQA